jgi:hypothetical protein
MRGWTLVAASSDAETQQVFLTVRSKFMVLSFNAFSCLAVCGNRRLSALASNAAPFLELTVPGASVLAHYRPRFDPHTEHAPDFAAFLHQVTIPLLRITEFFTGADNRWSIMPITNPRLEVGFWLVYRRRFTLSCFVRSAVPCTISVPSRRPSELLVCGLCELQIAFTPHRPGENYIFRLKLEQFARVRCVIEAFCELLECIAAAFAIDLAGPEPELSNDRKKIVVKRKVGGTFLRATISGLAIQWTLDEGEKITASLNRLTSLAPSPVAVINGAAQIVLVFFPVAPRLVSDLLGLMLQIADEIGFDAVAPAMESAMIQNNGHPSVTFQADPPFTVEFPIPYSPTGLLIVSRGSSVERLRGIESILMLLTGNCAGFEN